MRRKMRTYEDLLAALACYGIAGLALAYGLYVAGSPLDGHARIAQGGEARLEATR